MGQGSRKEFSQELSSSTLGRWMVWSTMIVVILWCLGTFFCPWMKETGDPDIYRWFYFITGLAFGWWCAFVVWAANRWFEYRKRKREEG